MHLVDERLELVDHLFALLDVFFDSQRVPVETGVTRFQRVLQLLNVVLEQVDLGRIQRIHDSVIAIEHVPQSDPEHSVLVFLESHVPGQFGNGESGLLQILRFQNNFG